MNKQQALLIIDLQNDYFPQGKYPLHDTDKVLSNIKIAIDKAKQQNIPIILIQHIALTDNAPFFNKGSVGVEIHPDILSLSADADIVEKSVADSFHQTNLEQVLATHQVTDLLIVGMMTQNCITHTAISKAADKYDVSVIQDCCTTMDEMINKIALNALSTRVNLKVISEVFC